MNNNEDNKLPPPAHTGTPTLAESGATLSQRAAAMNASDLERGTLGEVTSVGHFDKDNQFRSDTAPAQPAKPEDPPLAQELTPIPGTAPDSPEAKAAAQRAKEAQTAVPQATVATAPPAQNPAGTKRPSFATRGSTLQKDERTTTAPSAGNPEPQKEPDAQPEPVAPTSQPKPVTSAKDPRREEPSDANLPMVVPPAPKPAPVVHRYGGVRLESHLPPEFGDYLPFTIQMTLDVNEQGVACLTDLGSVTFSGTDQLNQKTLAILIRAIRETVKGMKFYENMPGKFDHTMNFDPKSVPMPAPQKRDDALTPVPGSDSGAKAAPRSAPPPYPPSTPPPAAQQPQDRTRTLPYAASAVVPDRPRRIPKPEVLSSGREQPKPPVRESWWKRQLKDKSVAIIIFVIVVVISAVAISAMHYLNRDSMTKSESVPITPTTLWSRFSVADPTHASYKALKENEEFTICVQSGAVVNRDKTLDLSKAKGVIVPSDKTCPK